MKKSVFWSMLTLAVVAMMSVGFASCGSDDDDVKGGGAELTGSWKKTYEHEIEYEKDGSGKWVQLGEYEHSYADNDNVSGIEFMAGGNAKGLWFWNGTVEEEDDFKYQINNGHLYLLEVDEADTDGWEDWGKITISGNTFELSYEDYDGSNYKYVGVMRFKKVG